MTNHDPPRGKVRWVWLIAVVAVAVLAAAAAVAVIPVTRSEGPPVRHVFVIVLENKDASATFEPGSPARYLSRTLPRQGAFIPNYYGVTHNSLGNYLALISGQGSTPEIQANCPVYSDFVSRGFGRHGQALGRGCVYPAWVQTLPDQLSEHGLKWKGYMEDMGNNPEREATACAHPEIGRPEPAQHAVPGDQYAARHNPFVYFHSIIDSPDCAANVVPLSRLGTDLENPNTVPNFAVITPNLCNDGHDSPCVSGEPGGLVSIDVWLRKWVPVITSTPTFQKDGLLLVTFDEAEEDADACCREADFPDTRHNGWPTYGNGGGRIGAVAISPFIQGGTITQKPYNHYSTLRAIEDLFGLPRLGYADSPDPGAFGNDVFTAK